MNGHKTLILSYDSAHAGLIQLKYNFSKGYSVLFRLNYTRKAICSKVDDFKDRAPTLRATCYDEFMSCSFVQHDKTGNGMYISMHVTSIITQSL